MLQDNCRTTTVYPRVCGGTVGKYLPFNSIVGLSPRVRGNPPLYASRSKDNRSIPACAGEPHSNPKWAMVEWVYPRVCGGTIRFRCPVCKVEGLSPRVRGNRLMSGRRVPFFRSIPACAGEPIRPLAQPLHRAVYPRVCGGTLCHLDTR